MTWPRRAAIAVAGVAGIVVGAAVAFVAADLGADSGDHRVIEAAERASDPPDRVDPSPSPPAGQARHTVATEEPVTGPSNPDRSALLVWTSGGLPPDFSAGASRHPLVLEHTVVVGDQLDLLRTSTAQGVVVDEPGDGWAFPIDVIAIDPPTFAGFVALDDQPAIDRLERGTALLTRSSAALRRLGTGDHMELRSGSVTIGGIIDDHSGGGSELVIHADDAASLGAHAERYLLVMHRPGDRDRIARELADLAAPAAVRFRSPAETSWLRHGDAVTPPVFVKLAFGEFAYRDRPGRDIDIDPAWVSEHIVEAQVPILGTVRCHRSMIEPLRSVMAALVSANLAHLVDASGFSGCWNPRRIAPGEPLSRHAWGVAVDLNIGDNPRGSFSTQDPRLVDLMRSAGFVWGGSWLVPDPGHYELDPP